MAQVREIQVSLDRELLIRSLGPGPRAARFAREADWAVEVLDRIARPLLIADIFPVEPVDQSSLRLHDRRKNISVLLTLGPMAHLLSVAESALVSVLTLGPGIDDLHRELQENRSGLRSFVLDTAAVLALGLAGRQANRLAEEEARKRGWGVGRRLSPGDLAGWKMEEQRLICGLLPLEEIGVGLTSGGMLVPLKSGSSVIGLGPAYQAARVESICRWCRNRRTCPIRWLEEGEGRPEQEVQDRE